MSQEDENGKMNLFFKLQYEAQLANRDRSHRIT